MHNNMSMAQERFANLSEVERARIALHLAEERELAAARVARAEARLLRRTFRSRSALGSLVPTSLAC